MKSSIDAAEHSLNPVGSLPVLKPMPRFYDDDDLDDILLFHLPEDELEHIPFNKPIPMRRDPVLDVEEAHVPASLLRRVARELTENECDSRTVFSACRGLARGSREFEEAYSAARIRSFVRHQRPTGAVVLIDQLSAGNPTPMLMPNPLPSPKAVCMGSPLPPPSHPMAIVHLGDLMSHFGIWVTALLAVQAWCALKTAAFADEYLEGGKPFYFAASIFFMLAIDALVWFRRRRHLSNAFHVPGVVLFLSALLPVFALHIRGILCFTE